MMGENENIDDAMAEAICDVLEGSGAWKRAHKLAYDDHTKAEALGAIATVGKYRRAAKAAKRAEAEKAKGLVSG